MWLVKVPKAVVGTGDWDSPAELVCGFEIGSIAGDEETIVDLIRWEIVANIEVAERRIEDGSDRRSPPTGEEEEDKRNAGSYFVVLVQICSLFSGSSFHRGMGYLLPLICQDFWLKKRNHYVEGGMLEIVNIVRRMN
ncbi:hypothetical protein Ccrd_003047 [Cynara cardunculus var. scolymus]|uniref:Uncharacterized protein n=1 Tax=Cynara cardunculus var. scolymus TaxID=59895 RepID=A0A124SCU5_CYNCS|nr:hypothetical protein Ccrd_003047 [Cynara cardunculus var. scolymus]